MDQTQLAQIVGGVRTGVGAALVVLPGVAGRIWIGPGAASPGAKVLARAVGARDLVLGLRTLEAGDDRERSALWLHLGYLASAADVAAAVVGWRQLSPVRRVLVPLVAGGVGVAGYQAWQAARAGDGQPSAQEVLGENLTEGAPSSSSSPGSSGPATESSGPEGPGSSPSSPSPSSPTSAPAPASTASTSSPVGDSSPASDGTADESRLLSLEEAAEEIGSPPAQVMTMVEEGLIQPEPGTDPPRFRAGVVRAAHLAGG